MLKNKYFILSYAIFLAHLYISFFVGEVTNPGAIIDNQITFQYVEMFFGGFQKGIIEFAESGQRVSPLFFFFISIFYDTIGEYLTRILYIFLSSLIPIIFFKIISTRYNIKDNFINLLILSFSLYFNPFFRASAIYITSDNLILFFFSISILEFVKFEKKEKRKNFFLFLLFMFFSIYLRPTFLLIILSFFILKKKIFRKIINIYSLLFITILIIPIIFYQYIYFIKFANSEKNLDLNLNFLISLQVFLSILFVSLFPIILSKKIIREFLIFIKKNLLLFGTLFISIIVTSYIFPYYDLYTQSINRSSSSLLGTGGGLFYKISLLLSNYFIFVTSCFLGLLIVIFLFKNNYKSYLFLIFLMLCYPLKILYQKYYEIYSLILIFGVCYSPIILKIIKNKTIYSCFLFFLWNLIIYILSIFYYSV